MPGAQWFPGARLNFAEHVFRHASQDRPAVIARSEGAPVKHISWAELEASTATLAATLREWGTVPGDRVASYMPNLPETLIAFLACASVGAVWSSCAPDMGAPVVLDRLRQIEPKVLFATDSYSYNGKTHDRSNVVDELLAQLPSVERVVQVAGPLDRHAHGCLARLPSVAGVHCQGRERAKRTVAFQASVVDRIFVRHHRFAQGHGP